MTVDGSGEISLPEKLGFTSLKNLGLASEPVSSQQPASKGRLSPSGEGAEVQRENVINPPLIISISGCVSSRALVRLRTLF
jgi:hypothetical protein